MKLLYWEFKILLCLLMAALLLGLIIVKPCAMGQKGSLLGRCYAFDGGRWNELTDKMKNTVCHCCKK